MSQLSVASDAEKRVTTTGTGTPNPVSGVLIACNHASCLVADLIDGHVSVKQCKRAVTALMEYALKQQQKREENELLSRKEEYIWLQISVKRDHAEAKLKPRRIPIKYPLVDPRDSAVCLITKDPQQAGVKFVNRVVGVEKLKGKFKPFEARRALLRENALFLADDRVIPLFPRLLGNIFSLQKVLPNPQIALPAVIAVVRGGWDNVQNLSIKSSESTSLLIWSCKLGNDEGARWHGLTLEAEEGEDSEDDELTSAETPGPRTTKPARSIEQPPVLEEK
ncbi:ribosomal protein L1p/L10e family-domain-containing protein [Lactarius hengduanensis]|nr:ribosomal protein L1p/L10e family-domain-containing protein [Lactarius hengduanensis]